MKYAAALVLSVAAPVCSAQSVTEIWAKNCAGCHAADGRGGGEGLPSTRTLLTDELFDQKHDRPFFDAIKSGAAHKDIEPFVKTMNDAQAWSMVVHIRELQRDDYRKRVGGPKPVNGVYSSKHHKYKVETVVESGLKTPWSVDFITGPLEGMIITNRGGDVMLWRNSKLETILKIPPSIENGQGGMMDVEVHPNFKENGWIYLAYADPLTANPTGGSCMTRIVRGKLKEVSGRVVWSDQQNIFRAKQEHYINSGVHHGCKIAFDPKDSSILFFGIGERGQGQMAQDLKRPNGKIHRVKDDGAIPKDNPFVGQGGGGVYESIWSYGHRNPQGLRFDAEGNLWDTEHGPRGGDELNLIQKGCNYGWPIVSFGMNYNDSAFRTPWIELADTKGEKPKITMPTYRWLPSIAACGLGNGTGGAFPQWKGDLFAGGLAGNTVQRLRLKVEKSADGTPTSTVVEREELLYGLGRVRDITPAVDGTLYVVLNDPDKVIRIVPADK